MNAKLEELVSTPEGKHAVRFRTALAKELVEESLPLAIFADKYYKRSRCVIISHKLGNQNFDATVRDKRIVKSPLEYLEVTQAHEGEDAHLRMLYLEKEGHVSPFGKVFKTGTKNTSITVEVKSEAIEHSILVDREIKRIRDAALNKSSKKYPVNTGLVIVCDDYVAFRDEKDIAKLKEYIVTICLQFLGNFKKVFVVGWSSQFFLEFEPNAI